MVRLVMGFMGISTVAGRQWKGRSGDSGHHYCRGAENRANRMAQTMMDLFIHSPS
jgi:hypothetical protein